MLRYLLLIPILLAGGLPRAALAQASLDQVFLSRGALSRGTLAEVGKNEVKLDVNGTPRTFQVNEIARITFANEPSELNSARGYVLQKNFSLALTELRKLDPAAQPREVIKQDIEFYKALCQARLALADSGDKNAAITALTNFAGAAPHSFHFYETAEVLGELAYSLGKYADAAKFYAALAAAPWPDYQLRANAATGRALAADKQYAPALAKFEAVLSSSASTGDAPRQKLLAVVGKAICLAETGKAEAALAMAQGLIDKHEASDAVLFARAYSALGRSYRKLNKPKEALLAYLHVDLLYSTDAESHAESLYHLSKLWTEINKGDRAAEAKATLDQRYPTSPWTKLP